MTVEPAHPPFEMSPTLGCRNRIAHGFFGRRGGTSDGLYTSLNCGYGSGDDRANVLENRRRVVAALGLEAGDPSSARDDRPDIHTVYQVHGTEAVVLDDPASWTVLEPPRADAVITSLPGIALGILTADCAPVLFAGTQSNGHPVVAAAHAGWKGALAGIIGATVDTMVQAGTTPTSIQAVVGPCIAQPSYEVDTRFLEQFLSVDNENVAYFLPGRPGHHHFDLPRFVAGQLKGAGVRSVDIIERDTLSASDDYFSYRRGTLAGSPDYGRQLSAIGIRA